MPIQRNEETGNLEYVPFHRTPKEKRLKKNYYEKAGHFVVTCIFLAVYQIFFKRLLIVFIGDFKAAIILPFFKYLSVFIIITFLFYTIFIIETFKKIIDESKPKFENAIFHFVYVGILEMIAQIVEGIWYSDLEVENLKWFNYVIIGSNLPYILLLWLLLEKLDPAKNAYNTLKQYQRRLETKPKNQEVRKIDIKKLNQLKKERFSHAQRFFYRKKT